MTRAQVLTLLAQPEVIIQHMTCAPGYTAGYVDGEWWLVDLGRVHQLKGPIAVFPTLDMLAMALDGRLPWDGWRLVL